MIIKNRVRNLPKTKKKLEMYLTKWSKISKPSPTEQRILNTLLTLPIIFFREVSFRGFGNPKMPYRFDFYLPNRKVVIEYDGKHHKHKDVKARDTIKNKFCKKHNIKVIRFNIIHYPDLEEQVLKTLKKLKII